MGTSSSSSGPSGGVSFDPPWLNSIAAELGNPVEQITGESVPQTQSPQRVINPPPAASDLAPKRRFGNARRHLGVYASSGDRTSLQKALKLYSQKGMGGASRVAKRMQSSTSAGAGLYSFFQGIRDSADPHIREWVHQLTSKNYSAFEIADKIIDLIISTGGSLDEESCRDSMAQALSELLERNPEENLLSLGDDSIWTVLENFLANEAFNRICLDIGQLFEGDRIPPKEAVSRMNGIREYLQAEISAQLQALRVGVSEPTKTDLNVLLQSAIRLTFEVFEEIK